MGNIASFDSILSFGNSQYFEVLMLYHKMGTEKAAALGWKQQEFRSPTDEELALAKKILLH